MTIARKIMCRIDELARISDEPGKITRLFASAAMRRANNLAARWMREAGMKTRSDAMGNLIGHYAAQKSDAKTLLLGSHLDTVRNAGKFDGPLGVLLAIACVEKLHRQNIRLPFALQVIAFADEEGVRYQTAYLGSRVVASCFDQRDTKREDVDGISMAAAIKNFGGDPAKLKSARLNPKDLVGYFEAHIEQGPVLQSRKLAVGIVSAIAGQTRASVTFAGRAGHAGTTPMSMRRDALCAAAEFVLAVEKLARKTAGFVATVGEISTDPGASNVIPGHVRLSLDARHPKDSVRKNAYLALKRLGSRIARRRNLRFDCEVIQATSAIECSKGLTRLLGEAVERRQKCALRLPSGAGHDAAVLARITPAAMLFIRCKNGISHHPDESVKVQDVTVAAEVMIDFVRSLAERYEEVRAGKSIAKSAGIR